MHKQLNEKSTKYNLKIKSKIHTTINLYIMVDLHCYERMTHEKAIHKSNKIDLYCHEKKAKTL